MRDPTDVDGEGQAYFAACLDVLTLQTERGFPTMTEVTSGLAAA
jgi:hypothetical protein